MPRKKTKKTAKRRGKAYKHPIPSRSELLEVLQDAGKPLKADQVLSTLGLKGQRMRSLLVERPYKMVRSGQIIENRRG